MTINPEKVFQTPEDEHYFFGYYDKSPLDAGNKLLLAQRAPFMDRMVEKGDRLEIGLFNWADSEKFEKLAETKAWNWQQGCMLQWLGPDHRRRIIYNDRAQGRFVSVVLDVNTGEKKTLPMAVYTVSPDGARALCIDNERHYWFRPGYNYQGIENTEKQIPLDESDGIWSLDLDTGDCRQVVNIMTLMGIQPLSTMAGGTHYLEHLMMSPSGRRFCFLHRWKMPDGGIYARLFTAGVDGKEIRLLVDSGRMSHFNWLDDQTIVAYGGMSNSLNALRRRKNLVRFFIKPILPVYHALVPRKSALRHRMTGDGYMIIDDATGNIRRLAPELLREDGHPSRCPADPNLLLSDTYEDKDHHREVFLIDMAAGEKVWHQKLRSIEALDSTGMRCDLHPKWSFDGSYFAVDTMADGHRAIYLYAID